MKIFQYKTGKLVELKDSKANGKYFNYESIIQELIEKNISEIFIGLEFIKSEFQIDDLRPDTIAFDVERKSFVIIEYKNVMNRSLVDQGFAYYQLLQERRELFVLLYSKVKGKLYEVEDINWDETRIIFISPYFTKYQEKASGFPGLPIELYEIRQYEDGIITLRNIEGDGEEIISESKTKLKVKTRITLAEYIEDDYLAGKYHNQYPTPETKNIYFKLKNTILDNFPGVEYKQKKIYAGFYSKEDGSCVCTLEVVKHKIILTYSTSKKDLLPLSDFVKDMSEKGHHGVGRFQSEIENEDDIRKSLPLIQKVYEEKAGISFSSSNLNTIKILYGSSQSHSGKYLDPEVLTVKIGERVKWQNDDTASHTVTSGDPENGPDGRFDSSLFAAGKSYEVTFNEKGTFSYFCQVHTWKKGKIIVE